MNTASDLTAVRSVLFGGNDGVVLSQVAYNTEQTIAAFGDVSPYTVRRLIHSGDLPTRNTGKQYLVSGATIVDVLGRKPAGVNDPREVIDQAREYTLKQLATLLGLPYLIAHRLTHGTDPKITPERRGTRLFLPGHVILGYLGGRDEPIRYRPAAAASA